MRLPPDLRDWVPPGHIVHFVMDAVELLDTGCRQSPRQCSMKNRNACVAGRIRPCLRRTLD